MNPTTARLLRSAAQLEVAQYYSGLLRASIALDALTYPWPLTPRALISHICRLVEGHVMPPPGVHTSLPAPTATDVEQAVREALADYTAAQLESLR